MQIVIDIPYGHYFLIKNGFLNECIKSTTEVILTGKILPKGHGRLIDVNDLTPDSDYEDGIFYAVSIGQINGAPTIIEADRESEVEETVCHCNIKENAELIAKILDYDVRNETYPQTKEALDMAVEALSAEPCEDCISRGGVNAKV